MPASLPIRHKSTRSRTNVRTVTQTRRILLDSMTMIMMPLMGDKRWKPRLVLTERHLVDYYILYWLSKMATPLRLLRKTIASELVTTLLHEYLTRAYGLWRYVRCEAVGFSQVPMRCWCAQNKNKSRFESKYRLTYRETESSTWIAMHRIFGESLHPYCLALGIWVNGDRSDRRQNGDNDRSRGGKRETEERRGGKKNNHNTMSMK